MSVHLIHHVNMVLQDTYAINGKGFQSIYTADPLEESSHSLPAYESAIMLHLFLWMKQWLHFTAQTEFHNHILCFYIFESTRSPPLDVS